PAQLLYVSFCTTDALTDLSPLTLHDALPISSGSGHGSAPRMWSRTTATDPREPAGSAPSSSALAVAPRTRDSAAASGVRRRSPRSEEHTSELQSRENLVCRLLLEKKKHHQTQ